MKLSDLVPHKPLRLAVRSDAADAMKQMCISNASIAKFETLGSSEQGREILGFTIGTGPRKVNLIAGTHADEPVGSTTIQLLITEGLKQRARLGKFLNDYTFYCIPQVNPDGEARNRQWIDRWPDPSAYIANVVRELPGRDIEFGYPSMRVENQAAASFWRKAAPLHLHISLHGMGFAEGVMLLIERHWASRTQLIRDQFTQLSKKLDLGLHIHNRKGEKGFFFIENGYTTTPEGDAMKAHFTGIGDDTTASKFHNSSMEYVRSFGGDPLCLVTEIPLFLVGSSNPQTLRPENHLQFQQELPKLKALIQKDKPVDDKLIHYGVRTVPLETAVKLQLHAIELGLNAIV